MFHNQTPSRSSYAVHNLKETSPMVAKPNSEFTNSFVVAPGTVVMQGSSSASQINKL